MLNSTFPTRACPAARVVKSRKRHVGRAGRRVRAGRTARACTAYLRFGRLWELGESLLLGGKAVA